MVQFSSATPQRSTPPHRSIITPPFTHSLGVKKRLDGTPELLGLDKAIDDSDLQTIAGNLLEPVPQFSYQPIRRCGVLLGLLTIREINSTPLHQEVRTAKASSKVPFTLGTDPGIPPRQHVSRNEYGLGFMVESVRPHSMTSSARRPYLSAIALMLTRCFSALSKRLASHPMSKRPKALLAALRLTPQSYMRRLRRVSVRGSLDMQIALRGCVPLL